MKVEAIIEQADGLVGQVIDGEGYIVILERGKSKVAYLASSEDVTEKDKQQILIEHSLAELKTIIRPLPSMQLMFRGVQIYPPYFYSFPAQFRATVDMDANNVPVLKDITHISITVPYTGKTSEIALHDTYLYSAEIDYTATRVEAQKRTARAIVKSQKKLLLVENETEAESIPEDENRYARRISHHTVRVSGWLETAPSKNDIINHMLFFTTAIRASMVAVGPLREETTVWIRPSNMYRLIKSHLPARLEGSPAPAVDIIGQIDYLQDEDIPLIEGKLPKLVFSSIDSIIIHESAYLW